MASVTTARIGNPRNMTSPVVSWLDDGNPEKVVSGRHDLLPRLDRRPAQAHRIPRTTAASARTFAPSAALAASRSRSVARAVNMLRRAAPGRLSALAHNG